MNFEPPLEPPPHPPPHPLPPPAGYSTPAPPGSPYWSGYAPQWVPPRPGPAPGLAYAGFWIRFGAYLIDAAILDIPLYTLLFVLFGSQLFNITCTNYSPQFGYGSFCSGTATGLFFLGVLAITAIHGFYFTILWTSWGRTVGQAAVGLWVVNARDGSRLSAGKAMVRFLGYIVSGIVFDLGYMWVGWDAQKQGWHDKIANTFVVRRV